jgi:hypothetical protein
MRWLGGALKELIGLFVEDGSFALAILVWIAAMWLLLPRLGFGRNWSGVVLFAGFAVILVESAWRRTRG